MKLTTYNNREFSQYRLSDMLKLVSEGLLRVLKWG